MHNNNVNTLDQPVKPPDQTLCALQCDNTLQASTHNTHTQSMKAPSLIGSRPTAHNTRSPPPPRLLYTPPEHHYYHTTPNRMHLLTETLHVDRAWLASTHRQQLPNSKQTLPTCKQLVDTAVPLCRFRPCATATALDTSAAPYQRKHPACCIHPAGRVARPQPRTRYLNNQACHTYNQHTRLTSFAHEQSAAGCVLSTPPLPQLPAPCIRHTDQLFTHHRDSLGWGAIQVAMSWAPSLPLQATIDTNQVQRQPDRRPALAAGATQAGHACACGCMRHTHRHTLSQGEHTAIQATGRGIASPPS